MMNADPKVFERAIPRLQPCLVCCYAIDEGYLTRPEPTPENALFARIFKPRRIGTDRPWWPLGDRNVRVIALQLAACVARDNAL